MPHLAPHTLTAAELEAILPWPPIMTGPSPVTDWTLRAIVARPEWQAQLALWSASAARVGT